VKSGTVRVKGAITKSTTQWPLPGLELGPLNPEASTRETDSTKAKGGNRDVIERCDTHKGDIWKICHSGLG